MNHSQKIIQALDPLLSDSRRVRIRDVVDSRIQSVVPVLESIYDYGNLSAVLRTAEGLGLLDVRIIDHLGSLKQSKRVTQGAEKWIRVTHWKSTTSCLKDLQKREFLVCATSLSAEEKLEDLPGDQKIALVFGNERDGVSQEVLALADRHVKIPMQGFSQSFNISVAAALSLAQLRACRRGDLTPHQRLDLMADYYRLSVEHSDQILERFQLLESSPKLSIGRTDLQRSL